MIATRCEDELQLAERWELCQEALAAPWERKRMMMMMGGNRSGGDAV